ncbi:helix-turn-helix domain-containing protein [Aetokthonos hydrillicola Thurmond2011]|uniref:Helix-turn-helix domain-containing protein n=2 Tax=Aetokthonos TaxID=1550243 RepID=A0AAP5I326_9CYAN|nr:helix-turn-helix transcriptional regulator [Aetokthonos hydrillicola CCALA 1050]MBW4585036.1 helix-turn-helix domain-containing protein [Aetokthonos hydrillicola CCALA 1050]MDR9894203.1 helix-turn-helix domain-containing protein [Aetokthonos hydrillicola Thurmond2011]
MLKKTAALEQPRVSALIRELRQLTGLTQEQFAIVLGVTYTTVNRWENGRIQPSPLALKQIQAMLNEIINCSSFVQQRDPCQQLLEDYFPRE